MKNEQLAKEHPEDNELLSLVALRIGLCEMIGKGLVSLHGAFDIFDYQQSQFMMKRIKDEQTGVNELTI